MGLVETQAVEENSSRKVGLGGQGCDHRWPPGTRSVGWPVMALGQSLCSRGPLWVTALPVSAPKYDKRSLHILSTEL